MKQQEAKEASLNNSFEEQLPNQVLVDIPMTSEPLLPRKPLFVFKPIHSVPESSHFEDIASPLIADLKDTAHPDTKFDPDEKFHFQNAADYERFTQ